MKKIYVVLILIGFFAVSSFAGVSVATNDLYGEQRLSQEEKFDRARGSESDESGIYENKKRSFKNSKGEELTNISERGESAISERADRVEERQADRSASADRRREREREIREGEDREPREPRERR